MEKEILKRSFEKMGAGVNFGEPQRGEFNLDVVNRKFVVETASDDILSQLSVLSVDVKDRHLLLLRKKPIKNRIGKTIDFDLDRYLVGHDERDWFVAGVPDGARVSTVQQAKDALRPDMATDSIKSKGKMKNRNKRKNKGFLRQGEWFFIPIGNEIDDSDIIHKDEPITRGRSKPHVVSEIVRKGGRTVYANSSGEISVKDYQNLPNHLQYSYRQMVADANVYGRGTVRHPDHKTIQLPGWHRILSNTENEASHMGTLTFLD
jgi:hypothetical protein